LERYESVLALPRPLSLCREGSPAAPPTGLWHLPLRRTSRCEPPAALAKVARFRPPEPFQTAGGPVATASKGPNRGRRTIRPESAPLPQRGSWICNAGAPHLPAREPLLQPLQQPLPRFETLVATVATAAPTAKSRAGRLQRPLPPAEVTLASVATAPPTVGEENATTAAPGSARDCPDNSRSQRPPRYARGGHDQDRPPCPQPRRLRRAQPSRPRTAGVPAAFSYSVIELTRVSIGNPGSPATSTDPPQILGITGKRPSEQAVTSAAILSIMGFSRQS
jgi:hypothetical protein